jgi:hypothetical protein
MVDISCFQVINNLYDFNCTMQVRVTNFNTIKARHIAGKVRIGDPVLFINDIEEFIKIVKEEVDGMEVSNGN